MAAAAVPFRSRRTTRRSALLRVGDERLVARVRAGDDDAFEAIYDRYYLGLLTFCRHMLGSRDEAEDALQHSFASAYSALRAGDGVADLRPWLYTIARNRCLSALRAHRDELSADEIELRARGFDGLAGEIQMRADLRDLVDDLQRLPENQRAALVLFELGDQSHEQIAAVLGVRREKVKALVFQAREALLRARRARDQPCAEVRESVATMTGDVPRRSLLRSHIDRCPGCAAFEDEVRRQRAAFAAIMPVAPTMGLKASILAALGCGGAAGAAGGGATVAGSVAAGGTTVGLASLGAKGVVTKVLAVVALAGGASESRVATADRPPAHRPAIRQPAAAHAAPLAAGAAAVTLHAPASKFIAAPTLRQRAARTHHTAAKHAPAPEPAPASPVAPPPPVVTHAAPAPSAVPAATPVPVEPTAATAPATTTPAAGGEQQHAPAATTETTTAPSTPTTTQQDTTTTAPAAQAPAATAPATTTTTTTATAPATATDAAPAAAPASAPDTTAPATAPAPAPAAA